MARYPTISGRAPVSETGASHIPEQIQALLKPSVRGILVKGEPGVGKTTFSIELLGTFGKGVYISTRVSEEKIFEQNPDLMPLIKSGQVQQLNVGERGARFEDFRLATAADVVQTVLRVVIEMKEPLLVLDSWDALAKEVDKVERLRVEKSLMAIAETNGARLLFVGEEPDLSTTDYLVDAVLELKDDTFEGRRIRRIEWKKLRGSMISSRSSSYTLAGGKITMLKPARVLSPREYETRGYSPVRHGQYSYSTGSPEFDNFLGGGLPKGGLTLLEFGRNVGWNWHIPLLASIVCNFIANGGCSVISVPSANVTPNDIVSNVEPHIPRKILRSNLRVGSAEARRGANLYKIDEKDLSKTYHATSKAIQELKGRKKRPCLHYVGSETLEYMYGPDDPIKYGLMITQRLRRSGDCMIRSLSQATKSKEIFSTLANLHLKLDVVDGAMVLYSVKPPSELYNMFYDYDQGFPRIRMIPIV